MANRHAVFLHQFPYQLRIARQENFTAKPRRLADIDYIVAACIQHTDLHTDAVCVPARRMVVCTLCAAMPRLVYNRRMGLYK